MTQPHHQTSCFTTSGEELAHCEGLSRVTDPPLTLFKESGLTHIAPTAANAESISLISPNHKLIPSQTLALKYSTIAEEPPTHPRLSVWHLKTPHAKGT